MIPSLTRSCFLALHSGQSLHQSPTLTTLFCKTLSQSAPSTFRARTFSTAFNEEDDHFFKITRFIRHTVIGLDPATQTPEHILRCAKNQLIDKKEVERLGLILVEESPSSLGKFIKAANITDVKIQEKLGLALIKKSPWNLNRFIQDFDIRDSALLEKFADALSKEDYDKIPDLVKAGITNRGALKRLADTLAYSKEGASILAKEIEIFQISEPDVLKDFALKIIENDSFYIEMFISNSGLEDQKILKSIIKILISKDPYRVSLCLPHIKDLNDIKEIYLCLLKKAPQHLADCIQITKIDDVVFLKEFTWVLLKEKPQYLADFIQKSKLSDSQDWDFLEKMGLALVEKDPKSVPAYTKSIKSPELVKKLGLALASTAPQYLSRLLRENKLNSLESALSFLLLLIQKDPSLLVPALRHLTGHYPEIPRYPSKDIQQLGLALIDKDPALLAGFVSECYIKDAEVLRCFIEALKEKDPSYTRLMLQVLLNQQR